jgi:hypothetical protein
VKFKPAKIGDNAIRVTLGVTTALTAAINGKKGFSFTAPQDAGQVGIA